MSEAQKKKAARALANLSAEELADVLELYQNDGSETSLLTAKERALGQSIHEFWQALGWIDARANRLNYLLGSVSDLWIYTSLFSDARQGDILRTMLEGIEEKAGVSKRAQILATAQDLSRAVEYFAEILGDEASTYLKINVIEQAIAAAVGIAKGLQRVREENPNDRDDGETLGKAISQYDPGKIMELLDYVRTHVAPNWGGRSDGMTRWRCDLAEQWIEQKDAGKKAREIHQYFLNQFTEWINVDNGQRMRCVKSDISPLQMEQAKSLMDVKSGRESDYEYRLIKAYEEKVST